MKTKFLTKISSLALVLIMCLMALVGCASNIEIPESNAYVSGNGGLAVQKGEYLYFVNGYTSVDDMVYGDNKGGNQYSAIYRTKLGQNNSVSYDEEGKLENCELIIDKVCGFQKTQLYIFGDYIYYATPNTEKVVSGDMMVANFKLTDFYRAKLDGSERTLIYKTDVASDSTKFAFYKVNDVSDVYLALYDGTKLMLINCASKTVSVVCENASSVALPEYSVYNAENNQISKGASNVYYTRAKTEEEGVNGNSICYAKIGENVEHVIPGGESTYSVLSATNEALIYTKSSYGQSNNYVIPYKFNAQNELSLDVQNAGVQLDYTAHSSVYLTTFENNIPTGIITTNGSSKLVYIKLDAQNHKTYIPLHDEKALTPLLVKGTYVYAYDEDGNLYQINYKAETPTEKLIVDMSTSTEENPINKPYFEAVKNFSVCGNYIYFYCSYEGDEKTGYYLNRVDTSIQETYETELIGVVQAQHIKTKTESEAEAEL